MCVLSGPDGSRLCEEALCRPEAQTLTLLQAQGAAGQRSGRGQRERRGDGVLRAHGGLCAEAGASLSSRAQLEQMGSAVSPRLSKTFLFAC